MVTTRVGVRWPRVLGAGVALGVLLWAVFWLAQSDFSLDLLFDNCRSALGDRATMLSITVVDFETPCARTSLPDPDNPERTFTVRFNEYGFYDDPVALPKPEGVFRVLLVGDSVTQAAGLPRDQGFADLLENRLNSSSQSVEVVNAAMGDYATDRALLQYAVLGASLQPDLVLLAVNLRDDVLDNSIMLESHAAGEEIERPYFTLQNGALTLHNSPYVSPASGDNPAFVWLANMQQRQQEPLPLVRPEAPRVTRRDPYTLAYPPELGLYTDGDPLWADAWAVTERLITTFAGLVEAQGARFAVVILPQRAAVYTDEWTALAAEHDFLQGRDPTAPAARLEAFLEAEEIAVWNMGWTLSAWHVNDRQARLYLDEAGHLSAEGHEVVADRLYTWLRIEALVPSTSGTPTP